MPHFLNSSDVFAVGVFSKRGFRVRSFGTGTHVKLPGAAPDRPNVYDFSTTYDEIYNDLWKKDRQTYTFVLSRIMHVTLTYTTHSLLLNLLNAADVSAEMHHLFTSCH